MPRYFAIPDAVLDPRAGRYESYGRALTQAEVQRSEQLARITRVFTKIDRVLVGEKVSVTLAKGGPAPAWSDGKTVTLNTEEISDLDLAGMINIHGLNYHEVCHLLYTPRFGSELTTWVLDHRLMASYNMLEDQRIETLLVGRHPATAPYLSQVILRWLATDKNKVASNYVLVRGRRYLPLEVRKAFRDAFTSPELIPAIERIVDEYRLLAFPRDNDRAKVLIREFQREVLDHLPQQPSKGCEGGTQTTAGRPVGAKEQDKDGQSAKGQESKDEADEPQEPSQGQEEAPEDDESGEGAEGAGESESDEDGDDEGNGSGSGSDAGQGGSESGSTSESGSGSSKSNSNNVGEGTGKGKGENAASKGQQFGGTAAGGAGTAGPEAVAEAIGQAIEDIQNDQTVRSEMDARSKSINKGARDGWFHSEVAKRQYSGSKPSAALINAEKKFRQVLRRLSEDCEPGWETEQPGGRLSVRRAMKGGDPKEAFDRWTEGNEGSDLEVFIGIDASGSMCAAVGGGHVYYDNPDNKISGAQATDEAVWVLTSALKGMGADVTAVVFGSESFTVYSREDKVAPKVLSTNHGGGTHTLPALEEAERLFRSSQRRNRLLIMVTDGDWSSSAACDETMRRIEALGVLSAVCYIDTSGTGVENAFPRFGHGAQVFGGINKAGDLLPWGKALVTATIKRFGAPTAR